MRVEFDSSFHKRLIKIKDRALLEKVKQIILHAESAENIRDIKQIKKLEGFTNSYRIRVGDYRIGIELKKDTLLFVMIAHRKEIYKIFP